MLNSPTKYVEPSDALFRVRPSRGLLGRFTSDERRQLHQLNASAAVAAGVDVSELPVLPVRDMSKRKGFWMRFGVPPQCFGFTLATPHAQVLINSLADKMNLGRSVLQAG